MRVYVVARNITTTLARTDGVAALNTLKAGLLALFQDGGTYDIEATNVYCQWEIYGSSDFLAVCIECARDEVNTDIGAFRTTIKNGLESRDEITSVVTTDIAVLEQSDTGALDQSDVAQGPETPSGAYFDFNPSKSWYKEFASAGALSVGGTFRAGKHEGYGVADFVSSAYFERSGLAKPSSWTVMIVLRTSVGSDQDPCGSLDGGGFAKNGWGRCRITAGGAVWYSFGDGTNYSSGETSTSPIATGNWYVITIRYTAGQNACEVWVDGVSKAVTAGVTGATASTGTAYPFSVGRPGARAASYFVGQVARVWVWDTALSDVNRAIYEAQLMAAY